MAPSIYVGLAANGCNAALNYGLIYGLGWGFNGAPIATTVLRWAQLGFLGLYMWRDFARLAPTWPRQALVPFYSGGGGGKAASASSQGNKSQPQPQPQQLALDLVAFRKLAVPGAAMLALEAWAFEVSSLLAGLLQDLDSLGAHILLLNVCGFVFLR